ncbi:sigma-70 family RNA polymerase sigma factor [Phycisphaeraceae bacterium D3-23]
MPPSPSPSQFTEQWMRSRHVANSFVRSMVRDEYAAEDVLQKVAIAAATHFEQYDPGRPFAGWLIGIAKRQVAQHYREQGRDRHTFDDTLVGQIADAHEEVADELSDRMSALNACMGKLNKRGQEIIDLRYQQNLKPAKIADRVGTSATAITSLLHRLRTTLRDCIERQLKQMEGNR